MILESDPKPLRMKNCLIERTRRIALSMTILLLVCTPKAFPYEVITLNSGEIIVGRIVDKTETNISILVGNYDSTHFSTKVIAKSDIKSDEKESAEHKAVDLSGEWKFSTGYVGGRISLVQSNNYLTGSENFFTDTGESGTCTISGKIDYPKAFIISRVGSGLGRVYEYAVWWKDEQHFFLKSMSPGYTPDLYRTDVK